MAGKVADIRRNEVWYINCYALFMGYLLMAVRGLGFLVITWSTVVLLGGFVSDLEKKDFWSLTIITLVLTPRVSADVGLKGKLRYIGYSIIGVSHAISATLNPNETKDPWPRRLLAAVVWLCHLLVGPIVVCPLAALYMCGPLFSAGISAWRLIEHDYVAPKKEEAAHLQPALIVLYSLAMLQGFLFCYRFYSSFAREDLVNDVAREYKMNHIKEAVGEYLRETVIGCEKDPAFFKETDLATYAMGMIKSEKSENFLSGASILDALLEHPAEERTLTAELICLVASSGHVLEKLLQALDSTNPYGEPIRVVAANIVTHLASRIPLMQFPQGIQRIGSLIDISQQQFEEDGAPSPSADDYKKLMENGFVILRKLAADEDNCRTISNALGLLSKVMAPVSSDLLHLIDHEEWSTTIVAASLQVMCQFVAAPGETGAQLRRQISSNKQVIHGMEEILKCCGCGEQVRILTIEILTQLPVGFTEESPCVNKESRENFVKMLPSIFTDEAKDYPIRKLAGEALLKLSESESNAAIILKANDHLLRDLRKILLDAAAKGTNRIMAAKTLKHLCIHYKENDDYLRALKETMEDVMPKILREILPPLVLNGNDTLAENRTHRQSSPLLGPTDLEAQVCAPQDDGRSNNTSTCQQNDDMKLHAALLSLVAAIFDKLITQDHNLAQLVDKISPGDSPTSFANKLNELVRTKSQSTASCLSMMKNASKMVISMMKHSDSYLKEHFLMIFVQSLADACKTMSCLESSMILYSANRGTLKPYRTLASLVKEAEELLVTKEPKER